MLCNISKRKYNVIAGAGVASVSSSTISGVPLAHVAHAAERQQELSLGLTLVSERYRGESTNCARKMRHNHFPVKQVHFIDTHTFIAFNTNYGYVSCCMLTC